MNKSPFLPLELKKVTCSVNIHDSRAVRYDDIYRMDEIKSLSFRGRPIIGLADYRRRY